MTAPTPVPDGTTPRLADIEACHGVVSVDEATAMAESLRAVLSLHQPIDAVNYRGGNPRQTSVCTGCGTDDGNWQIWPCPTVRAINTHVDVTPQRGHR